MSKNILARVGALLIVAASGALMVPACTIHLRQGGEGGADDTEPATDATQPADDTPQPAPDDTEPAGGGAEGSGGFTPEEQEAIEAARKADPVELALTQARAGYAAYALSGLTESQIVDPGAIDEETLLRLIEENAPLAWDLAGQWIASLDPTTLSYGYPINVECMNRPFSCQPSVECDFAKYASSTTAGTASASHARTRGASGTSSPTDGARTLVTWGMMATSSARRSRFDPGSAATSSHGSSCAARTSKWRARRWMSRPEYKGNPANGLSAWCRW
ncbi:hypothetical protein [Sorangium sp. So ce1000]|uniref:hypothetical protein n=1 Tax=Sorangium sp. So ce1000 TaxID=3133325 RepID=UPI003F643457